jgi:hypothetical protein
MKVPIRMLGIATSVFWVLFIAFIVLAAYSVTDLRFDIGEPQFALDPDEQLIFNLPLIIDNGGYYSLREFHIATLFSNSDGHELSRAHTLVPVIPSGEIITINHNVTLNLDDFYQNDDNYLFEDNDLEVSLSVGLNFAEVLPSQISTNFTFPWGAPFNNFDLGQPDISRFNVTHSIINVPMSFENHALYDVLGSIDVELYNDEDALVSETRELIDTPQQTSYDENIELFVPINDNSLNSIQNGNFNIYFSTLIFEHGPMVIPYD